MFWTYRLRWPMMHMCSFTCSGWTSDIGGMHDLRVEFLENTLSDNLSSNLLWYWIYKVDKHGIMPGITDGTSDCLCAFVILLCQEEWKWLTISSMTTYSQSYPSTSFTDRNGINLAPSSMTRILFSLRIWAQAPIPILAPTASTYLL